MRTPFRIIATMQPPAGIDLLRLVVAAAQAATILLTWSLWQVRDAPPPLPLFAVPQLPFGVALLVTLALSLWRPLAGALLHSALLAAAIVWDQTREQPQLISLAVLLWATVPMRGAALAGALHLVALWFWSGIGKLTSERFLHDGGAWLLGQSSWLGPTAAAALGGVELLFALLALLPRTRRAAAWAAAAMHLAMLTYLVSLGRDGNSAVWPWNVALAFAAPILLARRRRVLIGTRAIDGLAPRFAAVLFVLLPLGYRAGYVDAAFAQQAYVLNAPVATWLRADGRVERVGMLPELNVFLPPVPRVFAAWFERTARPGDQLVIVEPRLLAKALGQGDHLLRKTRKVAP